MKKPSLLILLCLFLTNVGLAQESQYWLRKHAQQSQLLSDFKSKNKPKHTQKPAKSPFVGARHASPLRTPQRAASATTNGVAFTTLDLSDPQNPVSFTYDPKGYWTDIFNYKDYSFIEFNTNGTMAFTHKYTVAQIAMDYADMFDDEEELDEFMDEMSLGDGFWDGFTISKNGDNTELPSWIGNDNGCMAGGGIKTDGEGNVMKRNDTVLTDKDVPYLVGYASDLSYYGVKGPSLQTLLYGGVQKAIGMYVNLSPWMYYYNISGDALGRALNQEGDSVKLIIHGLDDSFEETGKTVVYVLAHYKGGKLIQSANWEWVDLSALGEIGGLSYTIESPVKNAYGMLTPAYFCMDKLQVRETAGVDVKITMNSVSRTMTLKNKSTEESVEVGAPNAQYMYSFVAAPGDYILTGYNTTGVPTGTIELSIYEDGDQHDGGAQDGKIFRLTTITAYSSNTGWSLGTDYELDCYANSREGVARTITSTVGSVTAGRKTFLMHIGDSYRLIFAPSASRIAEGYIATFNHSNTVTGASAIAASAIPLGVRYSITVPEAATLYVGGKWGAVLTSAGGTHYVPFIDMYPIDSVKIGGKKTYTYSLGINCAYNFRVSQPGKLTHGGTFRLPLNTYPNTTLKEITAEMLNAQVPTYINHDVTGNAGANVADILMNINAEGHLKLKTGQTHQLLNLRSWQLTDNSTNNYFIEPDYHYTIVGLDGNPSNDVIEIDKNQTIRTKGSGTAIVQVTYDAIHLQAYNTETPTDYYYGALWSAIWPENTGTFVVTVDEQEDAGIKRNITLPAALSESADEVQKAYVDAEHDVLYYLATEPGYAYKFKPEGVSSVSIANPTMEANISKYSGFQTLTADEEGYYNVLFTFGRNILKLTSAGGASVYQVVTAKPVSYEISNASNPGLPIQPGDQAKVQFNGFFSPANKLAGIYNMSTYVTYNGIPNGASLILSANQYQFAGTPEAQVVNVKIPLDWNTAEPFKLEKGALQVKGFGSQIGKHRGISPTGGVNPNFTAVVHVDYFGSIPEAAITVNPQEYYKVNFTNLPDSAILTVYGRDTIFTDTAKTAAAAFEHDFTYGSYSYTASCKGYQTLRETFEITAETPRSQTLPIAMKPITSADWDGITQTKPDTVTADESNTLGGKFEGMKGYYKITGGNELAWFANETNSGRSSHNAVMTNDISLSNFDWTKIGNSTAANKYKGTFDGGGYTIDRLYIYNTGATTTLANYQALFGYINAATIKNLTVKGAVTVTDTKTPQYTAGIVGYSEGASTLENCKNEVTVAGRQNVGGILAYSANAALKIENCHNTADVTASGQYSGGIAGNIATGTSATINKASNTGNIAGTTNLGGIVGNSGAATITNALNQGHISGTTATIGGISGSMTAAGTTTNAYHSGNISTTSATYNGGAIKGSDDGTLVNTYAYNGNHNLANVAVKTADDFASGDVARLLGNAFGQKVGMDLLPVLGGPIVYQKFSNNEALDTVKVTDTAYINVEIHDTTYVDVVIHDTTYVDVAVHDTLEIIVGDTIAPTITTTSLVGGTVGIPYNETHTATGNILAWAMDNEHLPHGLTLYADGTISGTPTQAGTYTFKVLAINSAGYDIKESSITIAPSSTSTSPNLTSQANPLKAWMQGDKLHVSGLTAGQRWNVYNISGTLIHQSMANSDTDEITLPIHGTYVIQSGNRSIKVVY